MNELKRQQVEAAYVQAHQQALGELETIRALISDLPAPGNDECAIHWGHVGELNEVNKRLLSVRRFLDGTEE